MKLGGGSRLGGGARLGGGDAPARILYRNLKGIAPPGFWPEDDAALRNVLLDLDSRILEHGQIIADRLLRDIFPHLAGETLTDFEKLLGIVPQGTVYERLRAVIGKWAGAAGPRPGDLRKALAPLLRPVWAWRDAFDDDELYALYTERAGAGSFTESGLTVLASIPGGATDATWPNNAPYFSWPLNAPTDDVLLAVQITDLNPGDEGLWGCALLGEDDSNAIMWGSVFVSGTGDVVRADKVEGGSITEGLLSSTPVAPAPPFWLIIDKQGDTVTFRTSTDGEPDTGQAVDVGSVSVVGVQPQRVAVFARNAGAFPGGSFEAGQWRYRHGTEEHNVTLIERTHDDLTGYETTPTSSPLPFQGCVVRWAEDAGVPDLRNAQRLADRMSQAHGAIHVGATGFLKCNSSDSLCNRGSLGR